jgi:hypothetical protein
VSSLTELKTTRQDEKRRDDDDEEEEENNNNNNLARPRTQHDCHHDTKIKPEAATAVIGLLMMGGKTPETC